MNLNGKEGVFFVAVILWTLAWKCYSSWLASKNNDKRWFVALVVLNTAGILDMIYVFWVLKKTNTDVLNSVKRVLRMK
ncbi:MAG: DUF5652 family protein [Candidatus Nomurabacteria bacterium]|nr:DUF5652 family protein [Candidatus Nomurabacteria bacterium]